MLQTDDLVRVYIHVCVAKRDFTPGENSGDVIFVSMDVCTAGWSIAYEARIYVHVK